MCFRKSESKYLSYRMNRLEYQMASFDNALSSLSAKVDAILQVLAGNAAALDAARAAVAEAEAKAAQVIADDAAEDAADDAARADALAEVSAKLDSVLNPPAETTDAPAE